MLLSSLAPIIYTRDPLIPTQELRRLWLVNRGVDLNQRKEELNNKYREEPGIEAGRRKSREVKRQPTPNPPSKEQSKKQQKEAAKQAGEKPKARPPRDKEQKKAQNQKDRARQKEREQAALIAGGEAAENVLATQATRKEANRVAVKKYRANKKANPQAYTGGETADATPKASETNKRATEKLDFMTDSRKDQG